MPGPSISAPPEQVWDRGARSGATIERVDEAAKFEQQTFTQVAFAFRVTPQLLAMGLFYALAMGFIGGLLPAIRAARLPIPSALREL